MKNHILLCLLFAFVAITTLNARLLSPKQAKHLNDKYGHLAHAQPNKEIKLNEVFKGVTRKRYQGLHVNNHFALATNKTFTSGFIPTQDNSKSALFWILYPPGNTTLNVTATPVVIWLQGGPGGSSQLGNFLELGPDNVTMGKDGNYTEAARSQSWNDQYNLLIIDHPIGVGYGYAEKVSDIPTNEDQVAQQFHYALLQLYQGGLKGYEQAPLFIFGESYAGHYIPAIGDYLTNTKDTPLAGVGIGDGWTDPINQLSNNGIFCYSVGLCNADERQSVEQSQLQGVALINQGDYLDALGSFDDLMDTIVNAGGGVNVYNYRVFGGYDDLEEMLVEYLNYPATQALYGSNNRWAPFNGDVYTALTQTDFMSSVAPHVSNLVEKLPVLLYNGQDDIIVNTPSALNWIKQLPWSRQADFNQLEFSPMYDQGQNNIGLTKQLGHLQVTIVNKAGHLAPMDQMNPSRVMLDGYIAAVLAGNFTQSHKKNIAA